MDYYLLFNLFLGGVKIFALCYGREILEFTNKMKIILLFMRGNVHLAWEFYFKTNNAHHQAHIPAHITHFICGLCMLSWEITHYLHIAQILCDIITYIHTSSVDCVLYTHTLHQIFLEYNKDKD